MTKKQAAHPSQTHNRVEQLHAVLSDSNPTGIFHWLHDNARFSPMENMMEQVRNAIEYRTAVFGQRSYEMALMGIPLVGQVRNVGEPVKFMKQLLRTARTKGIIGSNDGVVLLDTPLSRGQVHQIQSHQMYLLAPRLFARATQNCTDLILDNLEPTAESACMPAAIVVALVFWKTEDGRPMILDSHAKRREFGELVGNFFAFTQSDAPIARSVWGCPMVPFFDAFNQATKMVMRQRISLLFSQPEIQQADDEELQAVISLTDDGDGMHHLMLSIEAAGRPLEASIAISLTELHDQNLDAATACIETICSEFRPELRMNKRLRPMITLEEPEAGLRQVTDIPIH